MFILIPIFLFIIIYVVYKEIQKDTIKRHELFVLENSVTIKNLLTLNKSYRFYEVIKCFDVANSYDNEHFYNDISCEDFLIYLLQTQKDDILQEIKRTNYNKKLYKEYVENVKKEIKVGTFTQSTNGYNLDLLLKIEKDLFFQKRLLPKTDFFISIKLHKTNIHGFIHNSKGQTFNENEILSLIKRLENKNGYFYNDRGIWDALCRVERGKVTNKIRFMIYERDGYRCRHCGSTENLEIDHIQPIARGGKSTIDNLQTLCRNCNKFKDTKY